MIGGCPKAKALRVGNGRIHFPNDPLQLEQCEGHRPSETCGWEWPWEFERVCCQETTEEYAHQSIRNGSQNPSSLGVFLKCGFLPHLASGEYPELTSLLSVLLGLSPIREPQNDLFFFSFPLKPTLQKNLQLGSHF